METQFFSTNDEDFFASESQRLLNRLSRLQKEISVEKETSRPQDYQWGLSKSRADEKINMTMGNRSDDEEQLRYLKNENEKLKLDLAEAREYVKSLSEKNRRLISDNRQGLEAQAEVSLLKKQLQAMRSTMDKLPADEAASRLRIEVLEERMQEMQRQNFDLRRQLAGLTPEKHSQGYGEHSECEKCVALQKQKALQAKYIIAQAVESRRQIEEYRNECEKLKEANESLQIKISETEAKYEKELKDTREYRDLYRKTSERSAKWYKTQMEGFANDINALKSKVVDLEKYLVKAQLNSDADRKQQELIDELKMITLEAATVANQVKRWRNVYE